jgi:gas vesicle protein
MTTKSKVILGLIGAAAAGVIVGIVLAPDKGENVRKKVADTAGDWADYLSNLFSRAKDEVDELKSQGAKAANEAGKEAGKKINSIKESYS